MTLEAEDDQRRERLERTNDRLEALEAAFESGGATVGGGPGAAPADD